MNTIALLEIDIFRSTSKICLHSNRHKFNSVVAVTNYTRTIRMD